MVFKTDNPADPFKKALGDAPVEMLEVQPGVVTILADTAIRGADLDEARALEAKRAAEEAMKNRATDIDFAQAQVELAEAMAQLKTIYQIRKSTH